MGSNKTDKVLRSIERLAERKYLPIIGPDKGKVLADIVRRIHPKCILEVGTLLGYSTIVIAKELDSEAELITIEIDEDEAKLAKESILKAEVRPRIKILIGDALEIIPTLKKRFDFLFLDAAKSEYFEYLRLSESKLHKGSVVVADNAGVFSHSMREYLDYVRDSGNYRSHFIPVDGDGVEVSTRL